MTIFDGLVKFHSDTLKGRPQGCHSEFRPARPPAASPRRTMPARRSRSARPLDGEERKRIGIHIEHSLGPSELRAGAPIASESAGVIRREVQLRPVKRECAARSIETVLTGGPRLISKTALGRTFTTKEIEELPVAARDFTSLALLHRTVEQFQRGVACSWVSA